MEVIVCSGCGQKMMATDSKGRPACTTCIGLSSLSGIPKKVVVPDKAHCTYCKREAVNDGNLAFYDSERNSYYCGCRGWD